MGEREEGENKRREKEVEGQRVGTHDLCYFFGKSKTRDERCARDGIDRDACKGGCCVAHMRTMFPSVWSSFCTMNVPALATLVSRVNVSLRTPSGSTNFSAREG
jgi:hypothetical protein